MKTTLLYFFTIILVSNCLIAQDIFVKHFGDFSGQGKSVVADQGGNLLLAGYKYGSLNSQQFCVYKTKPNGTLLWLKEYGGALNDFATKIISTTEGGFAIIGYSSMTSTFSCITFAKIDNSGNLSWMKNIGGASYELANCIVQGSSGEYYIGGKKKNLNNMDDFYLLKTDVNGDTLWTKCYGGNSNETINSMALCSDGIIMAGYTESFGAGLKDMYLVKVDFNGNVLWSKTYGDASVDVANSVKQTWDGGFIIAGYSHETGTTSDIFIVKTNSIGDTLWTKTFSSAGNALAANDIIITQDGRYIIAGTNDVWQTNQNTTAYVKGYSRLMKIASNGLVESVKDYSIAAGLGAPCASSGNGNCVIQLADESCVMGGTFFNCSTFETMLLRTFEIGPTGINEFESPDLNVFPNPGNKIVFQLNAIPADYSLTLFDLNGLQVHQSKYDLVNQLTVEKGNLSGGIYFYRLTNSAGQLYSGKILFE